MEQDKQIFPEIKIFQPIERLKKVANFLLHTPTPEPYMSEHYRGAAAMLDRELDLDGEALEPNE